MAIELCKCRGCGRKQRTGDTYFCARHEPLWLASDERRSIAWEDLASYEVQVALFVERVAVDEDKQHEADGDDLGRRELISRLQARHENPSDSSGDVDVGVRNDSSGS